MAKNALPHPTYQMNQWVTRIWETDRRYYVSEVKQDIFGQWILVKRWGSQFSRRGNSQTVVVGDRDRAVEMLDDVARRRAQRHYRLVGCQELAPISK